MQREREGRVKGVAYLRNLGHLLVVLPLLISFIPAHVIADEVDDILALKSKNRDKIKHFSAEYTVETTQKSTGKTGRMRYRMKMERVSATELKGSKNQWRIETEILEPMPMKIKMEGDSVSFFKDGEWVEQKVSDSMHEQLRKMPEMSLGADSNELRKNYSVKVLRHNNPFFGVKTRTVGYFPIGKANLFDKMEEDLEDDGFVRNTRLYKNKTKIIDIHSEGKVNVNGNIFCNESQTSTNTMGDIIVTKIRTNKIEANY